MKRIFNALLNSLRALRYLLSHEKAIIEESVIFIISLPIAFYIAEDVGSFLLLIGSVVFVIIVEVLNTAIEATCNALTRDYRDEIRIAKDAGSLAVLLSIVMAIVIWSWIIIKTLFFV